MPRKHEITVLVLDEEAKAFVYEAVPRSAVVSRLTEERLKRSRDFFVLVSASGIAGCSSVIRELKDRLRVLFIRADVRPQWISETLYRSGIRALRNVVVYDEPSVVRRVLGAWTAKAPDRLIAAAAAVGDTLEVVSCSLERFQVPFSAIPALAEMPEPDRENFEIDPDGTRISWPKHEVDLDLDSIRYAVDPAWRERTDRSMKLRDQRFGEAVARVRERFGLTQEMIPGISERQVRRIEKEGCRPRLKTLRLLARAHDLGLSEYLDEVGQEARKIREPV